eukprot:jgi/Tetstr1/447349/TSEL_034786.t1
MARPVSPPSDGMKTHLSTEEAESLAVEFLTECLGTAADAPSGETPLLSDEELRRSQKRARIEEEIRVSDEFMKFHARRAYEEVVYSTGLRARLDELDVLDKSESNDSPRVTYEEVHGPDNKVIMVNTRKFGHCFTVGAWKFCVPDGFCVTVELDDIRHTIRAPLMESIRKILVEYESQRQVARNPFKVDHTTGGTGQYVKEVVGEDKRFMYSVLGYKCDALDYEAENGPNTDSYKKLKQLYLSCSTEMTVNPDCRCH